MLLVHLPVILSIESETTGWEGGGWERGEGRRGILVCVAPAAWCGAL